VIDGKRYLAHRLAWLYTHGAWPHKLLDHRNRVTGDNRIDNLREATGSQNKANQLTNTNNTSGFKGVYWSKQNAKWQAGIRHQGKQKHLGCFNTKEDAHTAYCTAATQLKGEFAYFG
jgi:hypothetical protein